MEKVPIVETKGKKDLREWFVAWLFARREEEQMITDDTSITPDEVRSATMSATFSFGVTLFCDNASSVKTVRDFVKLLSAQMPSQGE